MFLYFVPSLDTPESEKPVCMKTELVCLNHEVQFGVCFQTLLVTFTAEQCCG